MPSKRLETFLAKALTLSEKKAANVIKVVQELPVVDVHWKIGNALLIFEFLVMFLIRCAQVRPKLEVKRSCLSICTVAPSGLATVSTRPSSRSVWKKGTLD